MKERGTLHIKESSWHARLYRFWQRLDPRSTHHPVPGKARGYKENLCHYWRVVIFWAPLRAFLFAHPGEATFVTPATVSLVLVAVSAFTVLLIFLPLGVLYALLYALGLAALFGVCTLLAYLVERHKDAISSFFAALWRHLGPIRRPFRWFFTHDFGKRIAHTFYPWTLTTFAIVCAALVLFTVPAALVLGGAFALFGLIVSCCALYEHLEENLIEYKPKPRKVKEGDGFIKVTGHYLVAKKHGVCPFIELED